MVFLQNLWAMLVPATTVPVTIIGAFAAMAMLGSSNITLTLFALILSIGIVVDDAIIIVENASHYIERGRRQGRGNQGDERADRPVIGITLVLVAVFVPAAFLPGITGQLFRQFALVIAATAVISAINAVTLKPAQCALYLKPKKEGSRPNAFYRGFNKVYGGGVLRRHRQLDGPSLGSHAARVLRCHRRRRLAVHPTAHRLPADGGPGLLHHSHRYPTAPHSRGARSRRQDQRDCLERAGVAGWVTVGGLSILDGATSSTALTTFVPYKDWSERGAAGAKTTS